MANLFLKYVIIASFSGPCPAFVTYSPNCLFMCGRAWKWVAFLEHFVIILANEQVLTNLAFCSYVSLMAGSLSSSVCSVQIYLRWLQLQRMWSFLSRPWCVQPPWSRSGYWGRGRREEDWSHLSPQDCLGRLWCRRLWTVLCSLWGGHHTSYRGWGAVGMCTRHHVIVCNTYCQLV